MCFVVIKVAINSQKMKLLLIFGFFICATVAQRPSYAGSGYIGLPDLASRFKEDGDASSSSSPNLVNRFDGTTPKIPVDARGDVNLVNRLNTWPNQTKPFWFLNADHIEKHRGKPQTSGGNRPTTAGGNQPTSTGNRPSSGTNVPSENRFGSGSGNTDATSEIDDFGNPIRNRQPSNSNNNRFAGSLP